MRVLIAPFGSHGDVHPLLGLGTALRERGHEVIYLIAAEFGPTIERLGFPVVPLGDGKLFREIIDHPDLWHPRKAFPLVAKGVAIATRKTYEEIAARVIPGETVAVGGTLALGVRVAGEKLGIPTATVHLQPSILHSNVGTPVYPGLKMPRWCPVWLRRAFFETLYSRVLDPHVAPDLNGLRAELSLPPARRIMMSWIHESPLVIGFFPEWYGPPQPDWPKQVRLVGFPLFDERETSPMPEDLERFLLDGPPPIAFTPGSANVHGKAFFEASVEACDIMDRRGLLLTRFEQQIPKDLPATVRHVAYAPFSRLLPRVEAIVHHGGVGTAAQAMASGTPQLIMALAHDQYDNADRLGRLGVARRISPKVFRGPRLAKELTELITAPGRRAACEAVKARFSPEDRPAETAALLLEELLGSWNTKSEVG
ncbi:MAG: glycosyltransferase [Isosphaeraceae bacterium]|nr:glycosyltransferase [Isosphaeraceae bacterium]